MSVHPRFRIDHIRDCRECIPRIVQLHREYWEDLLPDDTAERLTEYFSSHVAGISLPASLVARDETGDAVGTVSIIDDDGVESPGYSGYWLASLLVAPSWQARGLGRFLIGMAVEHARRSNLSVLRLWTHDHQDWYERLGWRPVHEASIAALRVTVMERRVT